MSKKNITKIGTALENSVKEYSEKDITISFSGGIDYYLVAVIVFPTIIGMYFGSRFVTIANDNQLRKILGFTLLVLALVLLVREL